MSDERIRTAVPSVTNDSVYERCRLMSDAQLAQAIEDIRGNPKRGPRRVLRLGEIAALTALYREHERRFGAGGAA